MREAAERYCRIIAASLRPATVVKYRRTLGAFLSFLETRHPEVTSFSQLRRVPHVENWLIGLVARRPPYAPGTRADHALKLRRFFNDIGEDGWQWPDAAPSDLITSADIPPREHHLPNPLSPEADLAIQGALRAKGLLVARALLLARFTGVRVGELLRLRRDCVIPLLPQGHGIRVPLGKLRTERVVPIDQETLALIEDIRHECGGRPAWTDPETRRPIRLLICRANGHPPSLTALRYALHSVARGLGITERVYIHRLRHTYATHMLRCGMSIVGVMKLLGHRKIRMTLNYADVTLEDLWREFHQASAKAKNSYPALPSPTTSAAAVGPSLPATRVLASFDDLIAGLQAIRFDHAPPGHRRRFQRVVERLRRTEADVRGLLS